MTTNERIRFEKEITDLNIRIFRSFPYLLEACKMSLDLLEEHQDEANWYLKRHYNKLRLAINLAEGMQ